MSPLISKRPTSLPDATQPPPPQSRKRKRSDSPIFTSPKFAEPLLSFASTATSYLDLASTTFTSPSPCQLPQPLPDQSSVHLLRESSALSDWQRHPPCSPHQRHAPYAHCPENSSPSPRQRPLSSPCQRHPLPSDCQQHPPPSHPSPHQPSPPPPPLQLPASSIPLTESNLLLLNGDMPSTPKTPSGKAKTSPTTPSASASTSTSTAKNPSSKNIHIRQLMAVNGMPINDPDIKETDAFKKVMEIAKERIKQERHSPKPEKWIKERGQDHEIHSNKTEMAFVTGFYWPLMGHARLVKSGSYPQHLQQVQEEGEKMIAGDSAERQAQLDEAVTAGGKVVADEYEERRWIDDGVDYTCNQPYLRGSLPRAKDKLLVQQINQIKHLSNPQSDLTYGYTENIFKGDHLAVILFHVAKTGVCPPIVAVGSITEHKLKRPLDEAEEQAHAGASAVLNGQVGFCEAAGYMLQPGMIDPNLIVYSFTMDKRQASANLHCVQVQADGERRFHMHTIKTWILSSNEPEDLLRFKDAHKNVLEWLAGPRKAWVMGIVDTVAQKYKQLSQPARGLTLEAVRQESLAEDARRARGLNDVEEEEDNGHNDAGTRAQKRART